MEIGEFAQLHVECENKWKIWKIKNTYIALRHMATKQNIPKWPIIKPFIIDIFDDAVYIIFTNSKPRQGKHFIEKMEFPKRNRKIIMEYIKEIQTMNPAAITIHNFKGYPSAGSPNDIQ